MKKASLKNILSIFVVLLPRSALRHRPLTTSEIEVDFESKYPCTFCAVAKRPLPHTRGRQKARERCQRLN